LFFFARTINIWCYIHTTEFYPNRSVNSETMPEDESGIPPVAFQMTAILATMLAGIAALVQIQTPTGSTQYLPCPKQQPWKYHYEIFCLKYTPIWIGCFAYIVASQVYEKFNQWTYLFVCGGLALPLLLQPLLYPETTKQPIHALYSFKANLWIAVFSFIGNYWYTHYFYSVLKANYSMPSHRLNNVPIPLYFATHFYFSTYHVFSNVMIRVISTRYQSTTARRALYILSIAAFSYFTAFMETLTISSFPYYSFEDRHLAYTVGSAFYGIYFIVSFPMFFALDEKSMTCWDTLVHVCGCGMIVLCLLDFCRLALKITLVVALSAE